MRPSHVLVVDDSAVVRRMLARVLADDPAVGRVETAPNGRLALAKIERARPDVAILDIEMPEMDGLEALRRIRERWPDLPVLMFSHATERGAVATLDALLLGAVDYVTKPTGRADAADALRSIREQLVPKIRVLAERNRSSRRSRGAPREAARRSAGPPVEVLVIGSSTGGPDALHHVLAELPADFPVPILAVQHMSAVFTRVLAERLDSKCRLPVTEARSGDRPRRGHVYLAPGGLHMEVRGPEADPKLRLHDGAAVNGCRPAVDLLLTSAARVFGEGVLGLVLTGMGRDGLEGARAVRSRGGRVFVQDEASSVIWGMPGLVAAAGLADAQLPLADIGAAILERVKLRGRSAR